MKRRNIVVGFQSVQIQYNINTPFSLWMTTHTHTHMHSLVYLFIICCGQPWIINGLLGTYEHIEYTLTKIPLYINILFVLTGMYNFRLLFKCPPILCS